MTAPVTPYIDHINEEIARMAAACTYCGECFKACPMVPYTNLERANPEQVTRDVIDLLMDRDFSGEGGDWAEACQQSGLCIEACPEPINPRTMLAYARTKQYTKKRGVPNIKEESSGFFRRFTQTLKLVAGTQMEPERFQHLTTIKKGKKSSADIVFYFGCNLLQTPHIIFTVMDIFDQLGIDFVVQGGVGNCCGINHLRQGDEEGGGKIKTNSLSHFAAFEPNMVVTFCPTCQMQYTERPPLGEPTPMPFEHITQFLAEKLKDLENQYVKPVRKRVGLHEHTGVPGVNENVRKILASIPGLELVEFPQLVQNGYQCPTLLIEKAKEEMRDVLFQGACDAGIDTLATTYHSCYRELCGEEANYPFAVCNFISLIGEAMDIHHDAYFQRFRLMMDINSVLDQSEHFIKSNGMDPSSLRDSLANVLYGTPEHSSPS